MKKEKTGFSVIEPAMQKLKYQTANLSNQQ